MIIDIIHEVIKKRVNDFNNPSNNNTMLTIQLSSIFMRLFIDELNKYISPYVIPQKYPIKYDPNMMEIKYDLYNWIWIIRNRAYRDNTNDSDVEEIIYKHLKD